MSPIDLDELEKLHAAATQGEWLRENKEVYTLVHARWSKGLEEFKSRGSFTAWVQADRSETLEHANAQAEADAEYLRVALNTLPALFAELRELRELVGCGISFKIGRCYVSVADQDDPDCGWCFEAQPGPLVYMPSFSAALAAARKWEAENA